MGFMGGGVSALGFSVPSLSQTILGVKQAGLDRDAQEQANRSNIQFGREQMDFQRQSVQEQMDFQERMSNSAWQRATEDMKKAGINPMLAFEQGGASSPSGGSAVGAAPHVEPVYDKRYEALRGGITSALDVTRLMQELHESDSRIDLNKANAGLSRRTSDVKAADAFIEDMKRKMLERLMSGAKDLWRSFGEGYRSRPARPQTQQDFRSYQLENWSSDPDRL